MSASATWLPVQADGATALDRVFGLRPAAYAAYRDLEASLWDPARLDPALVELCRLRIAQLLGCDTEEAERRPAATTAGLTEAKIAELRNWPTSSSYTDTDRAVLNFTEKFTMDASSVDAADCTALTQRLSEPECTALTIAVSMLDAHIRFRVALGV